MTMWRAVLVGCTLVALVLGVATLVGCPKSPEPESQPPEGGMTGLPGYGESEGGPAGEGGAAPTGEPVKIGAIFGVTGGAAPLGEPEKRAAEMIEEQINAAGGVLGRPLDIIIKDDKSETNEAVLACTDLIETEKVVAIVGPSTTPNTMAIKDKCEESKVPLVSCAAGKTITEPLASFVFAVPQTDLLAVAKIVKYLQAEKITKVAIICDGNPYGDSGRQQMEKQFPAAGIEILASEQFGTNDTDMTPQLTKIKKLEPGAVVCWGTNPGPAHVAIGMKKLGMAMPLIQSHGVANAAFLELAKEAAEGVQLPAGRLIVVDQLPEGGEQKDVLTKFAADFKEKFSKDADTFAGHAYDSLHIVIKAIEAAGKDDREAVRDAIEKTSGFVGTAGTFNYSPTDHNGLTEDAFVWVKVEGNKWTLVE